MRAGAPAVRQMFEDTILGLGLKFDYKLSDHTRFSLNLQPGNHYWEKTYHTAATWSTTAAVSAWAATLCKA